MSSLQYGRAKLFPVCLDEVFLLFAFGIPGEQKVTLAVGDLEDDTVLVTLAVGKCLVVSQSGLEFGSN